jgi:putative addiction module component (TIGR02574 family)
MTTTTLKTGIRKAVENVNDSDILKAVYTILQKNAEEEAYILTTEQKRELDKRLAEHKAGKLKYYTLSQVKKATLKALGK